MDNTPKIINLKDYEHLMLDDLIENDDFADYLDENMNATLELNYSHIKHDSSYQGSPNKENVISYLEDVSMIDNTETAENIERNLGVVASIALHYVRLGISYLDLVQEGNLGLVEANDNFGESGWESFDDYAIFWIVRYMILAIAARAGTLRSEFLLYFTQNHDHLFKSEDEHEKKVKEVNDKFAFENLENRLSNIEIMVLEYYFGLDKVRRYSIYEAEKELDIEVGDGEEIFADAMRMLSAASGKVSL